MTRQRQRVHPTLTVPQAAKCAELMERFEACAAARDASDAMAKEFDGELSGLFDEARRAGVLPVLLDFVTEATK